MNWKTPENKELVKAFLSLKTPKEAQAFLRDLLTESEITDLAKRLETASLLSSGTSYPAIQKATGFSTTTIARVSKWLQEGEGGYKLILSRLAHHHAPVSHGRGSR